MSSSNWMQIFADGAIYALGAVTVFSAFYWIMTKLTKPFSTSNIEVISFNMYKDSDQLIYTDEFKAIVAQSTIQLEFDAHTNNIVDIRHELNPRKVKEFLDGMQKKNK